MQLIDENNIKTSFNKNGYYIFYNSVVDTELVNDARNGVDKIRSGDYDTGKPPEPSPWNPGDDPNDLCKIEQPQIANIAITELITSSRIGELAAKAADAEMIQVWWVQLLYKPSTVFDSNRETKVGWHQDWKYWKNDWQEGSNLFTGWFALSDVVEKSGPMKFIKGSHNWGEFAEGDFFNQNNSPNDFRLKPDQVWKEIPAVMSAGGMSFHDKLLLHGSSHNTSNEPRCSLAIHLRSEKSKPISSERGILTKYIDDLDICPIIYGNKISAAF